PLSYKTSSSEVEPMEVTNGCMKEILNEMSSQGVKWMYGRWLIEGAPQVLLFDTYSVFDRLDGWKADLWNVVNIPSPANDQETNDLDFYNNIEKFPVDEEAGKRGIYHRYCVERAAAHCCDVFTTKARFVICPPRVLAIAFLPSHRFISDHKDGVLPNGLNVVKFSAVHEFQNLHARNKEKIHSFVRSHFYGHYDFDLDNTLYFFTAGRYEYGNKGVDIFIESLERLNHRLRACNSPVTVVAFLIMPAATRSYTVDALKGQAVTKQLQETVKEITDRIGKRLFEKAARYTSGDIVREVVNPSDLLTNEEMVLLKRRVIALRRESLPPIVTHNMIDDSNDPILNQLRRLRLFNDRMDRVKVIFHPEFINSNNPLFGLDYDDFVRGCHLGVFPSYYEPWGYTPAECTVMGIPSITSNLSGFGSYMEELLEDPSEYGIHIVDRRMKSVEESIQQLADIMLQFCQKSRRQRINMRNRTERLSDLLDWKFMGVEYTRARKLALHRTYPECFVGADPDLDDFQQCRTKIRRPSSGFISPRSSSSRNSEVDFEEQVPYIGEHEDEEEEYHYPLILKRRDSSRDLTAYTQEQYNS
ncbi:14082_t:CDS:2, partial [Acaulospora colombiana]